MPREAGFLHKIKMATKSFPVRQNSPNLFYIGSGIFIIKCFDLVCQMKTFFNAFEVVRGDGARLTSGLFAQEVGLSKSLW